MPFVQRDQTGAIVGHFANPQPDVADEWVDENSSELETRPTLAQALSSLAGQFKKDAAAIAQSLSIAMLTDGSSEEAKKSQLMAEYSDLKNQYAEDVAAIKVSFGH